MSFSQDFIERVRDANNLIDILTEYTQFKKSGHQYMACCPLPSHNEKTPSFSASELKQVYHCFGCGRSGNIFDALRELKGFSFPESVEFLATRAGIEIPANDKYSKGDNLKYRKEKEQLLAITEEASAFFQANFKNLKEDHAVRKYAEERGLHSDIQQEFRIGYAPNDWEGLSQHFGRKKVDLTKAEKLKLVKTRSSGEGRFDMFRHRLMFPIQDLKGDVVGFGGRVLDKEQTPKYLNSPESEIFHKGKNLYGLNVTGKYIREQNQVLIVEGYMDLLALYSAGIKNSVATLGTAFTQDHAKLLKRFSDNIVIVFDGDKAGIKAAQRALSILLSESLIPKIAFIPDNKDPDDYVKEVGETKFREMLKKAPELFQWMIGREMKDFRGTPADKMRILNQMAPYLDVIPDDRLKSLYSQELASRLEVEQKLVAQSLKDHEAQKAPLTAKPTPTVIVSEGPQHEKLELKSVPKSELYLLNLALSSEERWHEIWGSDLPRKMTPEMHKLWLIAQEFFGQNPSKFDKLTAYLMTLLERPKMVTVYMTSAFQKMSTEELNKLQRDCSDKIEQKSSKDEIRATRAQMHNKSPEEQLKELERIMNIKKGNSSFNRSSKQKAEQKES